MPRRPKFFKPPSCTAQQRDRSKAERDAFYTGRAWRRTRQAFLRKHPLCVDCQADGRLTEATIPHHVEERLDRPDLAYSFDNLVALCGSCHTRRHKAKDGDSCRDS